MTRTTSQGLVIYETGAPATVVAAGIPTGDSVDAAIARVGSTAISGASAAAAATVASAIVPSKNMVNPDQVTAGFTLNTSSGAPAASATYSLTGFIPVVNGQTYSISNARNVCFYTTAQVHRSGTVINNPTSGPLTFTATADGFLRASYLTATYGTSFQVEKGGAVTPYTPYGVTIPALQLPAASLVSGPVSLSKVGDSIAVGCTLASSALTVNATVRRADTNSGFNINTVTLDGAQVHGAAPGDEVTPIRTQLGTVGGNHGYGCVAAFTNPDGKTAADLGSVWTDGSREYVLLAINAAGKLIVGGSYTVAAEIVSSVTVAPTVDLTHVSGATKTGAIPNAGRTIAQLYPSTGRMRVTVWCDGAQVLTDGTTKGRKVEVRESYEVYDYQDLYDKAKANVGVSYTTLAVAGAVRVSNVFTFTAGGRCRVRSELTAMKPTAFGTCGFVQAVRLLKTGAVVTRFVPGLASISGIDFGAGVDLDSYATNIVATTSSLLTAGVPPAFALDRMVEGGATRLGFALGYLPYSADDSSNANRITATPTNLWDLRSTDKSYPTVLNARTLQPGGRITAEAFRAYLTPAQTDAVVAAGKDALTAWSALDSVAALSGAPS